MSEYFADALYLHFLSNLSAKVLEWGEEETLRLEWPTAVLKTITQQEGAHVWTSLGTHAGSFLIFKGRDASSKLFVSTPGTKSNM